MEIRSNYSLLPFNTFGIDVSAKYFVQVNTVDELKDVLNADVAKKNELLILGGGSNLLLVNDVDKLVIKLNMKGISCIGEDDSKVWIAANAGEVWHEFVMHCVDNEWNGLENLSLIPGCVGASPMQNIGAYGVEVKDRFAYLEALNIETLEIEKFDNEACEFGYRESVFKRKLKGKYIITRVVFELSKDQILNTSYGAINAELESKGITKPTAKDVSNAVIAIRQSKLPDPKEIGNSGSFFKNPVVPNELFLKVKSKYPNVAAYKVDDDHTKLAAGWLIEQAGWKGKTIGNYGVHKNQALVLVNYGGAQGKEIYDLSEQIITDVNAKFGVRLEREVNIID